MARKNRFKDAQAQREPGGFVPLPHAVIRSEAYAQLNAQAVKLLNDLLAQYRGDNNGDLCAAWKLMHKRGWKSRDTLRKALAELKDKEWIIVARQGGKHMPSLYAITFYAINECGGKLDISPTLVPISLWRKNNPIKPLIPRAHAHARSEAGLDTVGVLNKPVLTRSAC